MTAPLELTNRLDLPDDTSEQDLSTALLALVTSAVKDESPRLPLSEVSRLIHDCDGSSLLSPLDALSVLLPSKDSAARDIITLLSKHGSAKEVIISAQEALERLENTEIQCDDTYLSPFDQLIILIDVYASAIPRLKLRRKTVSETLRPFVTDITKVTCAHGEACSIDQGRSLIQRICKLVRAVTSWAEAVTGSSEERSSCNVLLMDLLTNVLVICVSSIHSCVAQRTFAIYYPRLNVNPNLDANWESGEQVMQYAIQSANVLGYTLKALISKPSIGNLILLAHMDVKTLPKSGSLLDDLLPAILSAFQSGVALDECLALLLNVLHNLQESTVSPEIVVPLCTIVSSIASTHADPMVRHQAFRVLALLLSRSPPALRMEALKELTTDQRLPQMRTAAVGLVKEAVLEGLGSTSQNMFASRLFIQTFGPILYRPDPPDYLSKDYSTQELCESYEIRRIVESLSLYYVLLLRDKMNKTGIRDRDIIDNIEKTFISPLRGALTRWESKDNQNIVMPVVSLRLSLERIDTAVAGLNR
ncbi:hypothetical protein F5887DRAFT_975970 [Amanita rubescens]|nr:hypothetical protein F5887DRAFT_975970 [Amanita rubescens]